MDYAAVQNWVLRQSDGFSMTIKSAAQAHGYLGNTSIFVVGARGIPDVEGGAEKNAEMLFPRIAAAGFDVSIAGMSHLMDGGDYMGVRRIAIPTRRLLNTDKLPYYLYAMKICWKSRPDIVHLQGLGAALFLWAYKAMGCRVVVRYGSVDHTVSKWGVLGRLGFRAAEFQLRFADAVISVAPALTRRLAEFGIADRVYSIPNAIDAVAISDLADFPETDDPTPYTLFVGRVTAQKNVIALIEAFNQFAQNVGKPWRLLIAGGLDDVQYVESVRKSINGDPNIVLMGRCDRQKLEALYRRSAMFINPSVHEGSSNATLEAVSRDCAVIISDIPENRDFPLENRAFFDPHDVNGIAHKMLEVCCKRDAYQPDKRSFLTWADVAERTADIYRQWPRRKRARRYAATT